MNVAEGSGGGAGWVKQNSGGRESNRPPSFIHGIALMEKYLRQIRTKGTYFNSFSIFFNFWPASLNSVLALSAAETFNNFSSRTYTSSSLIPYS